MRDVRRLFLHDVAGLPSTLAAGTLPGLARYAERALMMAMPGDLVGVGAPIDSDYLAFLNALGVGPEPDHVVALGAGHDSSTPVSLAARLCVESDRLALVVAALGPSETLEIHPHTVTAEHFALASALEREGAARVQVLGGDPLAARRADGKHVIRSRAIELGIPVAAGEVVELPFAGGRRRRDFEPVGQAIQRQLRCTGQVLVRGSVGTAGSSTFIVGRGGDDTDGVIRRLASRGDNRVFLVEAMVDVTVSPNLHLRVRRDGRTECLGASDQRWGRPLVHAGNVYPSSAYLLERMEEWAHQLAASLAADGYAGDIGFDFVEYREAGTGAPRAFLAEANPRVNGANYPLALRAGLNAVRAAGGRTPLAAFASGTLESRARDFPALAEALGDLLYAHGRDEGVVPYLIGTLGHGRCMAAAFAPTREQALELYAEARTAMEAAWAAG